MKYKRRSERTSKWSDNVCYLLSLWFPRNTEAVPERIQTWWVRSWLLVTILVSYWSQQQLRQMRSFQTQWRTTSHDELSKLELLSEQANERKFCFLLKNEVVHLSFPVIHTVGNVGIFYNFKLRDELGTNLHVSWCFENWSDWSIKLILKFSQYKNANIANFLYYISNSCVVQ